MDIVDIVKENANINNPLIKLIYCNDGFELGIAELKEDIIDVKAEIVLNEEGFREYVNLVFTAIENYETQTGKKLFRENNE